jgi:type II secretory pathway component PulF
MEMQGDPAGAMETLADDYRHMAMDTTRRLLRRLPIYMTLVFAVLVFVVALAVLGPFFAMWGAEW